MKRRNELRNRVAMYHANPGSRPIRRPVHILQYVSDARWSAAMQKRQRAKAGIKPPAKKFPREIPGKGTKVSATWKYG